jgi:serine/threonine-protein kinase
MPSVEAEDNELAIRVHRQLERVLENELFIRSDQLSRFLRFVVERHLEGRGHELKETVIGVEVFGRKPDYNPKYDPVVRTEARRLRARLADYYKNGGKSDLLIIELPKGSYAPTFREPVAPASASPQQIPSAHRKARGLQIVAGSICLTAALAVWGWWRFQPGNAPIPIAVLPLINLSQDPANEYFVDGLTGEIIRDLSIIDGLAVRSQTSSFFYKGKPINVRNAGNQLAADYILEGSVLRVGRRLRINAQLVRVRDDFSLWSGSYDRELADIFAIQDEISRGIVNSLRLKLGRGQRRYQTSPEAYDLYLRARAPWVRNGWSVLSGTVASFEAVIAKDPSFAPAYADLAAAHVMRSGQFKFDIAAELPEMRAAAQKAVELDPLLAEAQDALALAYSRDAHWEQAEKSFRRAIELDPNCAMYYGHFAMYLLLPLGRIDEAVRQLHLAEQADPLSYEVHFDASYVLFAAGRSSEASRHCDKLPVDAPDKTWCFGRLRLEQGKIGESIRILEAAFHRNALMDIGIGDLGLAYALAGRRDEAAKLALAGAADPIRQARIFAGLGDRDRTIEALDRATEAGPFRVGRALAYPEFAFLRGDPRLKILRKKVGLPE